MDREIIMIVQTQTIKDYIEIVDLSIRNGITWSYGVTDINEHFWNIYKSRTCVLISRDNYLSYCEFLWGAVLYGTKKVVDKDRFCDYVTGGFKNRYDLR